MGWVTYIASDELASGHTDGTEYTLLLTIDADGFRERWTELHTKQISLSGVVETQRFGRAQIFSVTLEPIQEQDAALIREFLASTSDGQVFQFDPRGTPDTPVAAVMVVREDDGPGIEPFGRGLHGERMTRYSFEVRRQT